MCLLSLCCSTSCSSVLCPGFLTFYSLKCSSKLSHLWFFYQSSLLCWWHSTCFFTAACCDANIHFHEATISELSSWIASDLLSPNSSVTRFFFILPLVFLNNFLKYLIPSLIHAFLAFLYCPILVDFTHILRRRSPLHLSWFSCSCLDYGVSSHSFRSFQHLVLLANFSLADLNIFSVSE